VSFTTLRLAEFTKATISIPVSRETGSVLHGRDGQYSPFIADGITVYLRTNLTWS
jgi:hypothetical protein